MTADPSTGPVPVWTTDVHPTGPAKTAVRTGPSPTLITTAYAVMAAVAAGAAWWLGRRGVTVDTWPPFVQGTDSTAITRYSGAWLTAAAGAVLIAALLLVAVVRRVVRGRSGSMAVA